MWIVKLCGGEAAEGCIAAAVEQSVGMAAEGCTVIVVELRELRSFTCGRQPIELSAGVVEWYCIVAAEALNSRVASESCTVAALRLRSGMAAKSCAVGLHVDVAAGKLRIVLAAAKHTVTDVQLHSVSAGEGCTAKLRSGAAAKCCAVADEQLRSSV